VKNGLLGQKRVHRALFRECKMQPWERKEMEKNYAGNFTA